MSYLTLQSWVSWCLAQLKSFKLKKEKILSTDFNMKRRNVPFTKYVKAVVFVQLCSHSKSVRVCLRAYPTDLLLKTSS